MPIRWARDIAGIEPDDILMTQHQRDSGVNIPRLRFIGWSKRHPAAPAGEVLQDSYPGIELAYANTVDRYIGLLKHIAELAPKIGRASCRDRGKTAAVAV